MTEKGAEKLRHALLIGIDKYPRLPGRNLRGCTNDAKLWRKLLRDRFAFADADITLLLDGQATREGILGELEALIGRVNTDDIVVVFYAGHGSQIRYRAPETNRLSGWEETLVPHDSGRQLWPSRDIREDELRSVLLRLSDKTRFITLIFDCCHSATLHRDAFGERERSVEAVELNAAPVHGPRADAEGRWLPSTEGYVVIAACREDETAKEHAVLSGADLLHHGALTYFLSQEINQAPPRSTYRDVFERAAQFINAVYSTQHPQCEGAMERVLFETEATTEPRYVLVSDVFRDEVTLDAGYAQGVRVGSVWTVHTQDKTNFQEAVKGGPRIRITEVSVTSAKGRTVSAGSSIEPYSRAVEHERPIELKWPIEIHAEQDHSLQRLIADSPSLRLVQPDELAMARVYLVKPRQRVAEGDPVPQLLSVERDTWAVVRRDGQLCMPPLPLHETERLRDNLETWARHSLVRDLENPFSVLSNAVRFQLLLKQPDGRFVPADLARDPVEDGACFALEISSQHAQDLYLCILYIDANGGVSQLYPPRNGIGRLGANLNGRIGAGEGNPLRFRFPRDLSFALRADGSEPDEVTDYLKLFASTHPLDLRPLIQEGVRGFFRDSAMTAATMEDFTTVLLAIRVRRPRAASSVR